MRVGPNTGKRRLITAMFAAASMFAPPAVAQTYPMRPVRIIVPYSRVTDGMMGIARAQPILRTVISRCAGWVERSDTPR